MIVNRPALTRDGRSPLRDLALAIAEAGLRAADPFPRVVATVRLEGSRLLVGGSSYDVSRGNVVVLGAGKASARVAAGLEEVLGDRIARGLVVAREGQNAALDRVELAFAQHPIPGADSVAQARRLLELAQAARAGDVVVACFTGGSSALACLPPRAVATEEKIELHELLLASGAEIVEINAVRKHVSLVKGGRVAAAAYPGTVVNVTVSDVAGDVVDAITDPTVQDTTAPEDAIAVLRDYDLWGRVAPSVRAHLSDPNASASPKLPTAIQTELVVTGATVAEAMAASAASAGLPPVVLSTRLGAGARELGRMLAQIASEIGLDGRPVAAPCAVIAAGGEATVSLDGGVRGSGGPNQEAALAFAAALDARVDAAAVFADTDGSDGGTAFAGGVVDGDTATRARETGADIRTALRTHRASSCLEALGDALVTGPTGTNANDLLVVVVRGRRDVAR